MCKQGDAVGSHLNMKLSANEETLRHDDVRRRPSGFIMHMAQGGTDLGACAARYHLLAETSRKRMVYTA